MGYGLARHSRARAGSKLEVESKPAYDTPARDEHPILNHTRRLNMNLIRACFLVLAVLLPTSWTIANAAGDDMGGGAGSGGDMKKSKKKSKKKDSGDMGDKKGATDTK
jgi:hypothetical protein